VKGITIKTFTVPLHFSFFLLFWNKFIRFCKFNVHLDSILITFISNPVENQGELLELEWLAKIAKEDTAAINALLESLNAKIRPFFPRQGIIRSGYRRAAHGCAVYIPL
jgi:hypothetical protein